MMFSPSHNPPLCKEEDSPWSFMPCNVTVPFDINGFRSI
jgi:hypothetical protein